MSEVDIRAARERIETVEKRIAALAEAGVDVAALRTQLAFAHGALRESRLADIEAICDEVLAAARRLAEIGGRSPAHPPQARTPAPGTEALQRVKIQRAQLADEVRSAIDAEVKTQMGATEVAAAAQQIEALARRLATLENRPREAELAPLAGQIDQLGRRLAELAASSGEARLLSERLQSLEVRLATSETRPEPLGPDPQVIDRLAAIDARLHAIERRPIPAAQPAAADPRLETRLAALEVQARQAPPAAAADPRLETRLAALEAQASQTPSAATPDLAVVQGIVTQAIADALPAQANELLRAAIEKLPTRDDLHHIAETLRTDLDWRLERTAAEHGWCSLSDVQATVRRAIADQDPGAVTAAPSQLARLETTLAEFVQQSRDQQDRLISALAERVARHTQTLTKRMIVRESEPSGDTEELAPSSSGSDASRGSSRMAAITGAIERPTPGKSPSEMSLDPVPVEAIEKTRQVHGNTTLRTKRVEAAPTPEAPMASKDLPEAEPTLHDLVTAAVENALGEAAPSIASTLTPGPLPIGEGSSSGDRPTAMPTSQGPSRMASTAVPADLSALVTAEVARQLAHQAVAPATPSDADLIRAVVRALPAALQDEAVRCELFAVLALEATAKPGALGELTGLRRFLKRELQAISAEAARREPAAAS